MYLVWFEFSNCLHTDSNRRPRHSIHRRCTSVALYQLSYRGFDNETNLSIVYKSFNILIRADSERNPMFANRCSGMIDWQQLKKKEVESFCAKNIIPTTQHSSPPTHGYLPILFTVPNRFQTLGGSNDCGTTIEGAPHAQLLQVHDGRCLRSYITSFEDSKQLKQVMKTDFSVKSLLFLHKRRGLR